MKQVIIMRGISGSGKSTHAQQYEINCQALVISSDCIRSEISSIDDQSQNGRVFKIFNDRYLAAMDKGVELIVLDATNTDGISTELYIRDALKREYHVKVLTRDIDADHAYKRVCDRSKSGGLHVPKWVIEKQCRKLKSGTSWLERNDNQLVYEHNVIVCG